MPFEMLSTRAASCYGRIISDEACRKELWFEPLTRRGFMNNTPQVEAALLLKSGISERSIRECDALCASAFINVDAFAATPPRV